MINIHNNTIHIFVTFCQQCHKLLYFLETFDYAYVNGDENFFNYYDNDTVTLVIDDWYNKDMANCEVLSNLVSDGKYIKLVFKLTFRP